MKLNEYFKLIGYVLINFVIVWVLALISNKYFDVEINSDTAIILFIGIIATFIVLGNYSQVAEMRNQALEQTNNYNAKIDEFNSKLDEIDEIKNELALKDNETKLIHSNFYVGQVNVLGILAFQFYKKKQYEISAIILIELFKLLPEIPYNDRYSQIIEDFIKCIQHLNKSHYSLEISKVLAGIIKRLDDIWEIDMKQLNKRRVAVEKKIMILVIRLKVQIQHNTHNMRKTQLATKT